MKMNTSLKSEFLQEIIVFGMPSRSEIQRWLVAIYGHSGN